jgi:hypothetical protein
MSGLVPSIPAPEAQSRAVLPSVALGRRPGTAAFAWAIVGVGATFVEAIYRLGGRALATIESGLTVRQWLAFGACVVLFGYAEGYRALQRRFVPHVLARSLSLGLDFRCRPLLTVLAPLYAVSLLGAERRAASGAYASVGLIVAAVWVVRALPHPWRGIVDGAVAVALSWGLLSLVIQMIKTRR